MSGHKYGAIGDGPFKKACAARASARMLEMTRTVDVNEKYGLTFEDFFLKPQLVRNLYKKLWGKPSPIQEAAVPLALAGMNVIGRAKNGTGKTGAFVIPALEIVEPACKMIQATIVVPTHELAMQTSKVCMQLAERLNIKVMFTSENTVLKDDIMRLFQKVHVIVATPKRLLSLIEHRVADMRNCKMLILDEADELLTRGTEHIVERIIYSMPPDRQLMLFSATFPLQIKGFLDYYMPSPYIINLMECDTLRGITEYYIHVEEKHKVMVLRQLFGKLLIRQSMIFCNADVPKRIELVAKRIAEMGYSCYYLHDQMQIEHRNRVLHDFTQRACRNVVCTDLFARGIDAPAVNVVINFDLPRKSDVYLHRIGRTGRYGQVGLVINFVTNRDLNKLSSFQQELNNEICPIPGNIPSFLYLQYPYEDDVQKPKFPARSKKNDTVAITINVNSPHGNGRTNRYSDSYFSSGSRTYDANRIANILRERTKAGRLTATSVTFELFTKIPHIFANANIYRNAY